MTCDVEPQQLSETVCDSVWEAKILQGPTPQPQIDRVQLLDLQC